MNEHNIIMSDHKIIMSDRNIIMNGYKIITSDHNKRISNLFCLLFHRLGSVGIVGTELTDLQQICKRRLGS
jgi:hypothetical protein